MDKRQDFREHKANHHRNILTIKKGLVKMRGVLEQFINDSMKKLVDTYELERYAREHMGEQFAGEEAFAHTIHSLVGEGILLPILSRKAYGSAGALSSGYRIVKASKRRRSPLLKELNNLHPRLITLSFQQNEEKCKRDLRYIKSIDAFFKQGDVHERVTVRKRSFQLFRDEEFLLRRKGIRLLQDLGLTYEDLACYYPVEPFVYMGSLYPDHPGSVLIVDNLDIFHHLQQLYRQREEAGLPCDPTLIIYGDGERIENRLGFIEELPFFHETKRVIRYIGDLSYEQFELIARLRKQYPHLSVTPCTKLYEALFVHAHHEAVFKRRIARTQQKDEQVAEICSFFSAERIPQLHRLFRSGRYLPLIALDLQFLEQLFISL